MSFRARASAVALTAVACILLAPAAMASSGPVQVTGKQLKSALLPASGGVASVDEVFDQSVYQFASARARSAYASQHSAAPHDDAPRHAEHRPG